MKCLILFLAVTAVGTPAFAADAEHSDSTTMDQSTNPVTGTKKVVVKHQSKKKGVDGVDVEKSDTEVTKIHKNGKVERTEKKETETTPQK